MTLDNFIDLPEPKPEKSGLEADWFHLDYFEHDDDGWYQEGLELKWGRLSKVSFNIRYPQFECRGSGV